MTQIFLYLAMHLVGLAVCLAWGPRARPALCCALAFPVGLAVFVAAALLILVSGLPYQVTTVAAVAAPLVIGAVASLIRGRRPDRRTLIIAALWTAGFVGFCALASMWNLAVMTYDSHKFVTMGWIIRHEGELDSAMLRQLSDWGVFQVIAQAGASFTRQDLLYSLPVVLGGSFVPLFGLCLWHGLGRVQCTGRRRTVVAVLATAALFTTNGFLLHVFYIHTNLASAIYLFTFVALFWLAELDEDPSALPIAFACLAAFALQRVESPPSALLFLALTVLPSRLPRRRVGPPLAAFTAAVALWYELLARHVPDDSEFLTPARCRLVVAGMILFFLYWLVADRSPLRRLNRRVPALVAAAAVLAVVAAFALSTDHMVDSAGGLLHNLTGLPHWGYTWYAFAALALLGLAVAAPPFRYPFVVGVPAYLGFVLLLALTRIPYYFYAGDSGNRMALHVVPLIFFYFALKTAMAAPANSR